MIDKLILGTVQFGLNYGINNSIGKPSKSKVFEILDYASSAGIKTLDTANAYGDSELVIGKYIEARNKSEFNICSKFHEYNNITEIIESTLSRLHSKNIGCFSFHNYDCYKSISDTETEKLLNYKKDGIIEKIGVSIYTNKQLMEVINCSWIDVIQLPFNLLDCDAEKIELLKLAKNKHKIIHTRSVFLQGLFYKNLETLPDKLLPLKPYLQIIDVIALENNMSKNQLALSFVLQNNLIDNVLIGVDSIEQLRENLNGIVYINEKTIKQIHSINLDKPDLLNPSNWN
jgi:aryl-alcohol dehydrogenase-like predicted oxidoreductase